MILVIISSFVASTTAVVHSDKHYIFTVHSNYQFLHTVHYTHAGTGTNMLVNSVFMCEAFSVVGTEICPLGSTSVEAFH